MPIGYGPGVGASQKQAKKEKAAQDKARLQGTFTKSADEVINSIVENAGKATADPTAIGATNPVAANGTLPNAGVGTPSVDALTGGTYSNMGYMQDFVGLNGQPARISVNVDPKTQRPFIGMTNAAGTLDYVVLIGDPKNPGQYKVSDLGTAFKDFLSYYKDQPGGLATLKKNLYEEGNGVRTADAKASLGTGNTYDKTLASAIVNKILSITGTNYYNAGSKQFISYTGDTAGAGYAGTRTSVEAQLLDQVQAGTDLDSFMQQYLGRNATSQEAADYLKAYNSFAKEHPTKVTTTTDRLGYSKAKTSTGGMSQDEIKAIQVGMLSDALRAAGKNPDTISKLGGEIGRTISALKGTAADYGLMYDDNMALQDTIKSVQPGASVQAQQDMLKNLAKVKYKQFASAIDSGLTIKDITNQYSQLHNKYLETMVPLDPLSIDAQKALTGGQGGNAMTQDEYITYLKANPAWGKTQNAREDAASYLNTIGKMFGFVG